MYIKKHSYYSNCLERNMGIMIYGKSGIPVIAFPTQNSKCENLQDFGMIDTVSDYINGGEIQLITVDTIDTETWSDKDGDKEHRSWLQEQYYYFIVDELIPFVSSKNDSEILPVVTGFSMGAMHAAIVFLRRPDLFSGLLAVSGVYDTGYFYGDWMDGTLYNNAPEAFLSNMPSDHPYIEKYNSKRIVFCVGQGAWEDEGVRTLNELEQIFHEKGIDAWCDYWGSDVDHDWPWWKKMVRYHLPKFIVDDKKVQKKRVRI